jgi:SAM-dependent methyltransferase
MDAKANNHTDVWSPIPEERKRALQVQLVEGMRAFYPYRAGSSRSSRGSKQTVRNTIYRFEQEPNNHLIRAGMHPKGYDYIPLYAFEFFMVLAGITERAQFPKRPKPRFVDVGCGMGSKVIAARALGYQATGIEYNAALVEKAAQINGISRASRSHCRIVVADALKCDYHEYDVVFVFRPLFDYSAEKELEERLIRQMPVGGFIIFGMPPMPRIAKKRFRCLHVGGLAHAYQKIAR